MKGSSTAGGGRPGGRRQLPPRSVRPRSAPPPSNFFFHQILIRPIARRLAPPNEARTLKLIKNNLLCCCDMSSADWTRFDLQKERKGSKMGNTSPTSFISVTSYLLKRSPKTTMRALGTPPPLPFPPPSIPHSVPRRGVWQKALLPHFIQA